MKLDNDIYQVLVKPLDARHNGVLNPHYVIDQFDNVTKKWLASKSPYGIYVLKENKYKGVSIFWLSLSNAIVSVKFKMILSISMCKEILEYTKFKSNFDSPVAFNGPTYQAIKKFICNEI